MTEAHRVANSLRLVLTRSASPLPPSLTTLVFEAVGQLELLDAELQHFRTQHLRLQEWLRQQEAEVVNVKGAV